MLNYQTGAKLSHHVSTAVLCTPSRAALLTGRYAIRMGLTGLQDTPPIIIYAAGRAGLPSNETTFAKVAQQAGYFTAVVGKVSSPFMSLNVLKIINFCFSGI